MTLGVDPDSADARDLVSQHQKRLVGWFRARVRDRGLADDLAQRTWLEVLPRMHIFDPEQGTFWTFTLNRARHLLHRSWDEIARRTVSLDDEAFEPSNHEGEHSPSRNDSDQGYPHGRSRIFLHMLTRTVTCRRLPHEIVSFGFIKLLEWKPQRFVTELSTVSTSEAATFLRDEYLRDVPAPEVHDVFEGLHARLGSTLREFGVDRRTLAPYESLADRIAGTIRVNEFFSKDHSPEEAVTRWWAAVSRAVAADLLRNSDGALAEWLSEHPGLRPQRPRITPTSTRPTAQREGGKLE